MNTSVVTVTLPNHGLWRGEPTRCWCRSTVGGITLPVGQLPHPIDPPADTFTLLAKQQATATATVPINGGQVRLQYNFGIGPTLPATGFGQAGFGADPFGGAGSPANPATGAPINATDWTLDNFGEVLIACPVNGTLNQPLYAWDPLSGSPQASVISQGPTVNDGFFVAMPQRQIVCWGSTVNGYCRPPTREVV